MVLFKGLGLPRLYESVDKMSRSHVCRCANALVRLISVDRHADNDGSPITINRNLKASITIKPAFFIFVIADETKDTPTLMLDRYKSKAIAKVVLCAMINSALTMICRLEPSERVFAGRRPSEHRVDALSNFGRPAPLLVEPAQRCRKIFVFEQTKRTSLDCPRVF